MQKLPASNEFIENSQEEIFSEIGTPLVENAFNGYNGSIIAYGQTGSIYLIRY